MRQSNIQGIRRIKEMLVETERSGMTASNGLAQGKGLAEGRKGDRVLGEALRSQAWRGAAGELAHSDL